MMIPTYDGNPSTTINSSYSHTNVTEEIDLISYNKFSSLVRSIPKHNFLVIGGDMNVQFDKKTWTANLSDTTRQTEMGNI